MTTEYNTPKIVTDNLVLCLDAGNTKSYPGTGETWTDIMGGDDATLENGPTFNSGNGGSIVLDGSNDYVLNANSGVLPDAMVLFTFSIWMYFDANPSGSFGSSTKGSVIFSGNAVGKSEFIIKVNGTSGPPYSISFGRYGGSTAGSCEVTNLDMPIQQWHNVVLVRNGTSSQVMYLNGTSIGTGNVSNSFTSASMYIGGAPSQALYSGYFNGKIGNILKYNRALTAAEVKQNFDAQKERFGL